MIPDLLQYYLKIEATVDSLDAASQAALDRITETITFKKGEKLLVAGQICRKSYELVEGIARKYQLHNGTEHTLDIYFPRDIALSFKSYVLQKPSEDYIEALTDLIVKAISYDAFQKAKEEHPKLKQLDLMLSEFYGLLLEDKLNKNRMFSAPERYKMLIDQSPHIVKHIPLTHIASYLGITLETLSRIRAKRIF